MINFDKDRSDRSTYNLLGGAIGFYGSTLNARQYATKGYFEKLVAQVFTGKEKFIPGNPTETSFTTKDRQSWLQISYMKYAVFIEEFFGELYGNNVAGGGFFSYSS